MQYRKSINKKVYLIEMWYAFLYYTKYCYDSENYRRKYQGEKQWMVWLISSVCLISLI